VRGQGDQRLDDLLHPRLFEIDAADQSFADARGEGEILGHLMSNEALVGVPTAIATASSLIAIGDAPPKIGSHQAHCWREPDSNHLSRSCERL
jgi:hypothetical protein